jgi:PncC family amidohydrolase
MKPEASLGQILRKYGKTIAVAESCTGGLISSKITDVSGSSGYFRGGVIAYSNTIKRRLLDVSAISLKRYGAVSKEVVIEMAKGVKSLAKTDIGLGITGIAGPTGGTKNKPVGLVYIGLVTNKKRMVKEFRFKGPRIKIKSLAAQAALNLLCAHLSR